MLFLEMFAPLASRHLIQKEATIIFLDWRVASCCQLKFVMGKFIFAGVYNNLVVTSQKGGIMDEQILSSKKKKRVVIRDIP